MSSTTKIYLGLSIIVGAVLVYFGIRYDMLIASNKDLKEQVEQLNLQLAIANSNLGMCKENELILVQAHKECATSLAKEKAKIIISPLKTRQPITGAL